MKIHVAFLKSEVVQKILSGEKRYECRLSKHLHPARLSRPGDRLLLKESGGEIIGHATVSDIHAFDGLTPEDVDILKEWFSSPGDFEAAYWESKRNSRCATILELTEPESITFAPALTPRNVMSAWVHDFRF